MKGKIAYTVMIEKEIEIPDEIVEISKKSWFDVTEEEDEKMKIFSKNVWNSVENSYDCIGIYYEENGKNWVIEEY